MIPKLCHDDLLPKPQILFFSGSCDSFCQNAKRLEDQSLDQFQKDLKNFEAQFANAKSNSNFIPNPRGASAPVLGQDVNSPTTFNQFNQF